MEAFETVKGVVLPIDRSNVDTDAIIPKQYLKSVARSGFGANLFDEWRYLDHGEPGQEHSNRPINTDFVLNEKRYTGAEILLARSNFGCGSSREHAVWALHDYGIKVIIASSFADIFFNNCFKNGLLPLVLSEDAIDVLFESIKDEPGYMLEVDLESQTIITPDGTQHSFDIESFRKYCLINGFDDIDLTLRHKKNISEFEATHKQRMPWLFEDIS
ncbi:MAG: 3-isopropylmalate dehydratase small subunit [Arenicellales bacterium]|jgi:3-isopropylmalate/(R)-2-methylmalate dehydratase small subunit|nr:3-isopropylmalate dehydratase small subunit [Arenicellales bacterium]